MQTSKIKPGETYAMNHRQGDETKLVRFHVLAVITHRATDRTTSKLLGFVMDDPPAEGSSRAADIKVDPERLIGPYEEQVELVARQKRERIEAEAEAAEKKRLANLDRLALYRFVGAEPPKDENDYRQPFALDYGGNVDIRNEGTKLIVARVQAILAQEDDYEKGNI